MGLTLMGILTEDENRIVRGNTHIPNATVHDLIKRGYKPYRVKNGEISNLMKSDNVERFKLKFDFQAAKDDEDLTVYFLSDEELQKVQERINKINNLKNQYRQQIKTLDTLIPSYIQHELLNNSGD